MTAPIGIVFPQAEAAGDVGYAREFAVAAESLGYRQLVLYEHVLGAHPDHHSLTGPYTHETPFWEPFVVFGHLAALTSRIELALAVLVLPQRQTALVAKQVATLDLLAGERFVLGVGVGWNQVEYEALGQDFHTRGRRIEEQIPLLRRLWREDLVTHEGEFETIRHASILPRPSRDIPIWMGGWSNAVMDRLGRLGDGWMGAAGSPKTALNPDKVRNPDDLHNRFSIVRRAAADAGRDPDSIGINMLVSLIGYDGLPVPFDPDEWVGRAREWVAAGATQIMFATVDLGLSPSDHLQAAEQLAAAWNG